MSTALYRPQPMPAGRLRPGVVLLVLAIHGALLWMANYYWPSRTALTGANPGAVQGVNVQIVKRSTSSESLASSLNLRTLSGIDRQRFGLAEATLVPTRNAAVTTLSAPDADEPLKLGLELGLGLTLRYMTSPRMEVPGRSLASSKKADKSDCYPPASSKRAQETVATGPLFKWAIDEKCRKSK